MSDSPIVRKLLVRFAKAGRARFLSHHDLMRFCERAACRAGLPLRRSEGFNPRPRLVFPHPLGLGIASRCEALELELTSAVAPTEALEKLRTAMRPVLDPLSVETLPPKRQGRTAVGARYAVTGWRDPAAAARAAADFAAGADATVERTREDGPSRPIDLRRSVTDLRVDGAAAAFRIALGGEGAARPDEMARWLAARAGDDPRDLEIERTALDLS